MKYVPKIATDIIFLFVLFSITKIGIADDADIFYVIHVEGDVLHKGSEEKLKIKDKLRSENEVLFNPTTQLNLTYYSQLTQFSLSMR